MSVQTQVPRPQGQPLLAATALAEPLQSADHLQDAMAADRFWHQGLHHANQGQWDKAALAFGQASLAASSDALYWFNLANAQRHIHQHDAAVQAARRGLVLQPKHALGLHLLGESLARLHRYEDAALAFAELEATGGADASALLQHASVLLQLQRPHAAVPLLMKALVATPHLVAGHAMLANALRDMGLKREAVECMKTVLALDPGNLEALSHLSFEKRQVGDWSGLDADVQHIEAALNSPSAGRVALGGAFGLLSLPLSPEQHLQAARAESRVAAHEVKPLPQRQGLSEPLDAPIRLGFLSYDFREHPVSQLLVQSLELLDRQRFEVTLYSSGPDDGSGLRQRVQHSAPHFVDLRGQSDQQAAQRIYDGGINLLVDLSGHTRGHRMGVFARRPAPVQASFLGYPGSTGADFMDYIVGDPLVTPLAHAAHYSEKLAQLPQCLQPNGQWRPLPQPMFRAQAGLPEDAFVMCAFNHTYKILPQAFDLWCAVLREVPQAVLWLKQTSPQMGQDLRQQAKARGVAPERLLFAPHVGYAEHFSRMALADVFVDTWPFGGHTTASDALWAGLPVLTLQGNTYASRLASSIVHAAGLGALSFSTADDYLQALRALAQQPQRVRPYKLHLQQNRQQLPLFDCVAHTQALQQLFTRMVQRWRSGLQPDHLLASGTEQALAQWHPHVHRLAS